MFWLGIAIGLGIGIVGTLFYVGLCCMADDEKTSVNNA